METGFFRIPTNLRKWGTKGGGGAYSSLGAYSKKYGN